MRKIMKARKGGFTLVELLIVIIIIAILAGMMLLTTGAATDGAEASKLVNNLRSLKSAALLYYIDKGLVWPTGSGATLGNLLSPYMDRSIDTAKYNPKVLGDSNDERMYIGIDGGDIWTQKPGIANKLAGMAKDSGLYQGTAPNAMTIYTTGQNVYMNMR